MRNVAKFTGRIGRAAASGERVAEILDAEPELADNPWARPLRRAFGDLRLIGVTVAHPPGNPVLVDAELHVRPGERVGVVGPSGSGKSTLIALLLRMLDPRSGQVLLDEPTTGLDADSRRAVLAALDRLTAGRTVLVVAHHEELLASCDRIVRVADGRIVDVPSSAPRAGRRRLLVRPGGDQR
jgi:ABC-type multidrug transport system fused ATPase/permease subunit